MAPTTPRSGAVDTTKFTWTAEPPVRRVMAETAPTPPAPAAAATPPAASALEAKPAAQSVQAKAKLAALLLFLLALAFPARSSGISFWFTNDLPVAVTTMFYTNTSTGYFFLGATNTAAGASNVVSVVAASSPQGVAVQATNSSLARLVPLASLPATGSAVSLIYSNTAIFTTGVPPYTGTSPGTNVAGGSSFTLVAPGTNVVPSGNFNTNLP